MNSTSRQIPIVMTASAGASALGATKILVGAMNGAPACCGTTSLSAHILEFDEILCR